MRWLPGLLLAALIALPFGMGGRRDAVADLSSDNVLRVISPHRRETRMEYSRAFREFMRRERGREVDILWLDPGGGTSVILRDLESRYTANPDDPGVDILFGGGVDPYLRAAQRNWFVPVPVDAETLDRIPPSGNGLPIRDPDGQWYGVALASFGMIYNERVLSRLNVEIPRSWEDVGRPELFGWVAGGNPSSSGAVHSCYEVVLQAYGWERGWRALAAIAANTRTFGESASAAPTETTAGDAAVGMAIQHYAVIAIQAAGDPAVGFTLPAGQTIISPDGIALLRGSSRAGLAEEFIRFVLSPEGQRLLFRPAGVDGQLFTQSRYPVRTDLYDEPHAPRDNPYASAADIRYDNARAARRWDILNDLAMTWLIDVHPELSRAWRAVIARGASEEEKARLFAPPMGEEELLALAASDAAIATTLRNLQAKDRSEGTDNRRRIASMETARAEARLERRRAWNEAARAHYAQFYAHGR